MTAVILLFLVGIVLLGIEVFAPGAILGIFGAVSMLIGCIVAYQVYGATGALVATLLAVSLLALALYLEFVVLPRSALGRAITVLSPSEVPNNEGMNHLVGQTGVTETTLAPSGYVVIDGARHEALSQSGLIAKGESVRVVSGDAFRLIVNSTNQQT